LEIVRQTVEITSELVTARALPSEGRQMLGRTLSDPHTIAWSPGNRALMGGTAAISGQAAQAHGIRLEAL